MTKPKIDYNKKLADLDRKRQNYEDGTIRSSIPINQKHRVAKGVMNYKELNNTDSDSFEK